MARTVSFGASAKPGEIGKIKERRQIKKAARDFNFIKSNALWKKSLERLRKAVLGPGRGQTRGHEKKQPL